MEENSSKTKQYIFIAAGVIVVVVGCAVAFINIPIIEKVFEKKDALEEKKMQFELMKKQAAQSVRYTELVESFSEDRELIEKATIKRESMVDFIEEIEKISNNVGNEIEISNTEKSKKNKTSNTPVASAEGDDDSAATSSASAGADDSDNTVELDIAIYGDYRQFLQFYYQLENMPYVFSIDSFEIKKMGSVGSIEGLKALDEREKLWINQGEIGISFVAR
jgi:Tfp pilus assembly protein PilO